MQKQKRNQMQIEERRLIIGLLIPCIAVLLFLVIFPLVYNLWLSLHRWNLTVREEQRFIGLANYFKILFKDGHFWHSLLTTFIFGGTALAAECILGMSIALFLNRDFTGRKFIQTCMILPMVATPVAISYVWRIMYNPDFGIINYILQTIGLPIWKGIFGARTAMASIVIVDVWQWTPFLTMIFLSGLLALPKEPLEAADIDGASKIQKFRLVTLPLIRNLVIIGLILRGIDLFKTFDIIYSLTRGGPGTITETLNIYIFNEAFTHMEVGYSSALSIVAIIIASVILIRVVKTAKLA